MALGTYQELQTAILGWLARPGDPLVAPAVLDMIKLFESEADRRLRTVWQEKGAGLAVVDGAAYLPDDFAQLRNVTDTNGAPLLPLSGTEAYDWTLRGTPKYYTIGGIPQYNVGVIWLNPAPGNTGYEVWIDYLATIPPLSDAAPSNWLLERAPDAYLFGALAEAEGYIGHDERIQIWLQRREVAIEGLNAADRKYRWPGPMQIRVDIGGGYRGGGGGGGVAPSPIAASGAVRVVSPASGTVVTMAAGDRSLYIASGPLAELTILLPPATAMTAPYDEIDISFALPVTRLWVRDAAAVVVPGAPASAYGPGAGLLLRHLPDQGWIYWK